MTQQDQDSWSAVDDYFAPLAGEDDALVAANRDADAAGLPAIQVTATQGKLLQLLAQIQGSRRILEIGTLAGYSTIWLARALPADGRLVTCEYEPAHAAVARANVDRAGVGDRVEIRVGAGVDTLAALVEEGVEPFDLVFIDADKPSNPDYLAGALRLTRPGSVIVLDNAVRNGGVADAGSTQPDVVGTRRFVEAAVADPRLSGTAVQTVGSKGWDGFVLLRVQNA